MKMTTGAGAVGQGQQRGPAALTRGFCQPTTVNKRAPGTCASGHRRSARQSGRQAGLGQPWNRSQQTPGIGVGRRQQHLAGGAGQHHLAGIQHHHPVTNPGNGPKIVAHIDHGGASLAVDVSQQLQNMRLRGHVQPGGGFVKQQHIGLAGQRHSNCHPLLLATRELMRVAGRNGLGLWQTHLAQQFGHTVGVLRGLKRAVQRHGFQQLPTHTQRGSQ